MASNLQKIMAKLFLVEDFTLLLCFVEVVVRKENNSALRKAIIDFLITSGEITNFFVVTTKKRMEFTKSEEEWAKIPNQKQLERDLTLLPFLFSLFRIDWIDSFLWDHLSQKQGKEFLGQTLAPALKIITLIPENFVLQPEHLLSPFFLPVNLLKFPKLLFQN